MSIWNYEGENSSATLEDFISRQCIFCGTDLHLSPILTYYLGPNTPVTDWWRPPLEFGNENAISHAICMTCGWWNVFKGGAVRKRGGYDEVWYAFSATLKELNVQDLSVPLDEIHQFLVANYDARFLVSPNRFESVVASVFKGLGYDVRVTGRSGDGGIDAVLDGPGDIAVGVQVKRYRNSIKVEQIRSFTGALLIAGMTKGIFVTTSSFQSGVGAVARQAASAGVPVELVDAARFFDALRLSRRKMTGQCPADWPPSMLPKLRCIQRHNLGSL